MNLLMPQPIFYIKLWLYVKNKLNLFCGVDLFEYDTALYTDAHSPITDIVQ